MRLSRKQAHMQTPMTDAHDRPQYASTRRRYNRPPRQTRDRLTTITIYRRGSLNCTHQRPEPTSAVNTSIRSHTATQQPTDGPTSHTSHTPQLSRITTVLKPNIYFVSHKRHSAREASCPNIYWPRGIVSSRYVSQSSPQVLKSQVSSDHIDWLYIYTFF